MDETPNNKGDIQKTLRTSNTVFSGIKVFDYNNLKDYYRVLFDELYKELTPSVGGNPIAPTASATTPSYKLNGEKVHLLINKKKLHRSVYVKDKGNGKAKYCKINNEFVLLSKLKNKII
jgi:hypothetical protein